MLLIFINLCFSFFCTYTWMSIRMMLLQKNNDSLVLKLQNAFDVVMLAFTIWINLYLSKTNSLDVTATVKAVNVYTFSFWSINAYIFFIKKNMGVLQTQRIKTSFICSSALLSILIVFYWRRKIEILNGTTTASIILCFFSAWLLTFISYLCFRKYIEATLQYK